MHSSVFINFHGSTITSSRGGGSKFSLVRQSGDYLKTHVSKIATWSLEQCFDDMSDKTEIGLTKNLACRTLLLYTLICRRKKNAYGGRSIRGKKNQGEKKTRKKNFEKTSSAGSWTQGFLHHTLLPYQVDYWVNHIHGSVISSVKPKASFPGRKLA